MPKLQVIKYKCCKGIFAACREPHCYTDRDWLKTIKKEVENGNLVDTVEDIDFKFFKCDCKPQIYQLNLFENV